MTFDEFKEQNIQYWMNYPALCATARIVWDAATAAERDRCAGIAKKVGNLRLSRPEWLACSESIYERIRND